MAAVSSAMFLTSSTGIAKRSALKQFVTPSYVTSSKRNVTFRVNSVAEESKKEVESVTPSETVPSGQSEPIPPPKTIPSKPKVSTDFNDILAFSGPGPERINGRLAMIGFVTAIGVELANGQDVISQLQNGGTQWFIFTTALLTAASLIPLFQGVRPEAGKNGLFSPDAELLNGRFAMLGLVALVFTEYVKGGALV